MTNWVKNTIAIDKANANQVIPVCCPNGEFDFQTLIPSEGGWNAAFTTIKDGDAVGDVQGESTGRVYSTGHAWCDAWLRASGKIDDDTDRTFGAGRMLISFETAWAPPEGVIDAFADKFNIPFDHMYTDECCNFWGIDRFSIDENGKAVLSEQRYKLVEDFRLCFGFSYSDLFCNDYENEHDYENEREAEMLRIANMWDCLGWWNYIDHETEAIYREMCEENPAMKISLADFMLLAYQDAVSQRDSAAVHRISDHLYYVEDIVVPYNLPVTV